MVNYGFFNSLLLKDVDSPQSFYISFPEYYRNFTTDGGNISQLQKIALFYPFSTCKSVEHLKQVISFSF